jgi:flagellar basal body-associated protein FliL
MAVERVTEHPDGTTERVIERDSGGTTYVDRGGSGVGGVIIGIAVLALVAIIAFFLLSANHNDAMRTQAVSSAATSVADSAAGAAKNVGNAANNAADAVSGR